MLNDLCHVYSSAHKKKANNIFVTIRLSLAFSCCHIPSWIIFSSDQRACVLSWKPLQRKITRMLLKKTNLRNLFLCPVKIGFISLFFLRITFLYDNVIDAICHGGKLEHKHTAGMTTRGFCSL